MKHPIFFLTTSAISQTWKSPREYEFHSDRINEEETVLRSIILVN